MCPYQTVCAITCSLKLLFRARWCSATQPARGPVPSVLIDVRARSDDPIPAPASTAAGTRKGIGTLIPPSTTTPETNPVFDIVTMGELRFPGDRHKSGLSRRFGARRFEFDPTYPIISVLAEFRSLDLGASRARGIPAGNPG